MKALRTAFVVVVSVVLLVVPAVLVGTDVGLTLLAAWYVLTGHPLVGWVMAFLMYRVAFSLMKITRDLVNGPRELPENLVAFRMVMIYFAGQQVVTLAALLSWWRAI